MSTKDKLENIAVFLAVLLSIGIAFFIGRISILEKQEMPVQIRNLDAASEISLLTEGTGDANLNFERPKYGLYAASINSDVYHFWKCPSVAKIKDENLLWFDTLEEAEAEKKKPSADCSEKIEKAKANKQLNTETSK